MTNKVIHRIKLMITAIFFAFLSSGAMCACTDANGAIPSDKEVFRKVSSVCTNEEYELVSRVDISDSTPPACVEYTFVTKGRGLEFTAHSTLQNISWEGPSAWYSKVVYCNYAESVQSLYEDDVRSEIEKGMGTQFDPYIAQIMLQMIDEDKEYTMKQVDSMQRKILTVDDEMMNNKIIAHIMKDEPMYQLFAASSGMEALKILEQQSFDLILLDVKMPEMDGLETLKRIREKYQTPVVLMTGDKSLEISAGFAEYGCDDYITKPFLPLLVKEIVHNMTEQTGI